jgi:hypothetical protein
MKEAEDSNVVTLEKAESTPKVDPRIAALTPEEQKKLLWRIDVRLVATLGFMYSVSVCPPRSLLPQPTANHASS